MRNVTTEKVVKVNNVISIGHLSHYLHAPSLSHCVDILKVHDTTNIRPYLNEVPHFICLCAWGKITHHTQLFLLVTNGYFYLVYLVHKTYNISLSERLGDLSSHKPSSYSRAAV